jgi:ABC-type nitrate/sulfonate/bicarbonate transport system ATPase subunit
MAATAKLVVDDVAVSYATPNGIFEALAPIDLSIPAGRFVSIIGPSGCGKSTLFNVIAGLMAPTSGRVFIDDDDATGTIGRVSYMLQKDLLLPWRTVLDNVVLGLEIRGVPVRDARARILPYLRRYGLAGFEYQYPNALSGGMRQRAALMRTLILWVDVGKTIVFVTHDIEEAIYLSDEIYVMGTRPGRITEHIDVSLPHPRSRKILTSSEFVAIKERCMALISAGGESTTLAA